MRPTRLRMLLLTAVLAGLLAYVLVRARYSSLPPLPYTAALSTFLLTVAEAFLAPSVRARLAGRPGIKPIMPLLVARIAALAKASSALGALLFGAWVGAAAYVWPRGDTIDAARSDTPRALVGAAAAFVLIVVALWLESVCRVPRPPNGPPPAEPGP